MVKVYLGMFGLLYQANVVKKVGTCKPIDNSINNSRYRSALTGLAIIKPRDCKRRISSCTFVIKKIKYICNVKVYMEGPVTSICTLKKVKLPVIGGFLFVQP